MALRGRARIEATRACRVSLKVLERVTLHPRRPADKHAPTKPRPVPSPNCGGAPIRPLPLPREAVA